MFLQFFMPKKKTATSESTVKKSKKATTKSAAKTAKKKTAVSTKTAAKKSAAAKEAQKTSTKTTAKKKSGSTRASAGTTKKSATKKAAAGSTGTGVTRKTRANREALPLRYADDAQSFWAVNGEVLNSLVALRDALERMDAKTFRYHVRDDQNDFALWVDEVLGDGTCAAELAHCTTPSKAKTVVVRRLRSYDT